MECGNGNREPDDGGEEFRERERERRAIRLGTVGINRGSTNWIASLHPCCCWTPGSRREMEDRGILFFLSLVVYLGSCRRFIWFFPITLSERRGRALRRENNTIPRYMWGHVSRLGQ